MCRVGGSIRDHNCRGLSWCVIVMIKNFFCGLIVKVFLATCFSSSLVTIVYSCNAVSKKKTVTVTFPAVSTALAFCGADSSPLTHFWLFFDLRRVVVYPCFIFIDATTTQVPWNPLKHLQSVLGTRHTILFFFNCERLRHPSSHRFFSFKCWCKYYVSRHLTCSQH